MYQSFLFTMLLFAVTANIAAIEAETVERATFQNDLVVVPDKQVKVSRAEASEAQRSEGIENSIDGNLSTIYHSRWQGTVFPVTLTYYFTNVERIDYFIYYPRTSGSNGNFKELEVWTSVGDGKPEFVKAGEYDFRGSSSPSKISFPEGLKSPKAVRFVVKSGMGDGYGTFASCAEMMFFAKSPQPAIPSVFTDETCSELRPGTDRRNINAIENNFYRRLALSLFDNSYDKEFRVQEYKPYPRPETMAERNKTSTYSLLDNPTGITVKEGDEIIVFVGNTGGENLSLRLIRSERDPNVSWGAMSLRTFMLNEGVNRIIADRTGLLYVMYHTDNPNAKPVKIHFATGEVNGYYDVTKHAPEDWKRLLDNTKDIHFDMLGKYSHITYPVESLRSFCPDGNRLMQVYDSITWLQQRFLGFYKYNRVNLNRMYFYIDYNIPSGVGAYASSYFTGYPIGSMRGLCNPETLRSSWIWGPAHEVGHVNQTRPGFRWGGMVEVSNNVYSMHVQYSFGNQSRLAHEKLGRNDGNYNNRYEKGFTEIIAAQALHTAYSDVFCKLIPFWQLELYYSHVKGYTDFYADVHEQVRLRPNPDSDSEAILAFVKICCDVAKEDLTDFFTTWGLFRANETKVVELARYAQKYPKPAMNLYYIHDESVESFRNNLNLSKGNIEIDNRKVKLAGWENVTVFEVYDDLKPVFITPKSEFDIPSSISKPVIYAVPAKGKKEKIEIDKMPK